MFSNDDYIETNVFENNGAWSSSNVLLNEIKNA